jgi:hypothetical protein
MRALAARLLMEQFLAEGGAYGHLMHLYDNRDLTFAELKEVLSAGAEGRLEKATEKTDGMNLVFTWDARDGGVKGARSAGDIKKGGQDLAGLAARWAGKAGKEVVQEAFTTAFKLLSDAINSLPDKVKVQVFGPEGNTWYSMEIIYPANANVINYDKNYIVFHAHGSFQLGKDGKVVSSASAPGIAILEKHIDKMQNALSQRSWQIAAPQLARLKKLSDGSVLSRALSEIEAAQGAAGVGDDATIDDYLHKLMAEEVADLDLPPKAAIAVVARALGDEGAPGLNDIKKMLPKEIYPNVNEFIKASPAVLKKLIAPIEHAIHKFSVEVLRGMQSVMVASHDKEVERLRGEVSKAVKAIESSGDVKAMSILKDQLSKLQNLEDIASSSEGVVFHFKGNTYKFTGAFAPVNQILGLFKYGRSGTKIAATESLYLRQTIDDMIARNTVL